MFSARTEPELGLSDIEEQSDVSSAASSPVAGAGGAPQSGGFSLGAALDDSESEDSFGLEAAETYGDIRGMGSPESSDDAGTSDASAFEASPELVGRRMPAAAFAVGEEVMRRIQQARDEESVSSNEASGAELSSAEPSPHNASRSGTSGPARYQQPADGSSGGAGGGAEGGIAAAAQSSEATPASAAAAAAPGADFFDQGSSEYDDESEGDDESDEGEEGEEEASSDSFAAELRGRPGLRRGGLYPIAEGGLERGSTESLGSQAGGRAPNPPGGTAESAPSVAVGLTTPTRAGSGTTPTRAGSGSDDAMSELSSSDAAFEAEMASTVAEMQLARQGGSQGSSPALSPPPRPPPHAPSAAHAPSTAREEAAGQAGGQAGGAPLPGPARPLGGGAASRSAQASRSTSC